MWTEIEESGIIERRTDTEKRGKCGATKVSASYPTTTVEQQKHIGRCLFAFWNPSPLDTQSVKLYLRKGKEAENQIKTNVKGGEISNKHPKQADIFNKQQHQRRDGVSNYVAIKTFFLK